MCKKQKQRKKCTIVSNQDLSKANCEILSSLPRRLSARLTIEQKDMKYVTYIKTTADVPPRHEFLTKYGNAFNV